jgi:hypothetical protein
VDPRGQVVDARGPCNVLDASTDEARALLGRWGLGFGLDALVGGADDVARAPGSPAPDRALCAAGWPQIGTFDRPLRTLAELRAVLVDVDALPATLRAFLRRRLPECRQGDRWLVARPRAHPGTHGGHVGLVVVDARGGVVASVGLRGGGGARGP